VHDLASLQYQRMSAQACPPSGTIMPIGSAMPHNEHWADCDWRRRSLRCLAIDAPRPRKMLVYRKSASSSAAPAGNTAVADEAYAAMVPPREQKSSRPSALFRPAPTKVITQDRITQANR
jgi:hypothetical protein